MFQFTHPVWGATAYDIDLIYSICEFQFTHPVWGATTRDLESVAEITVSIHAPRVGCDDSVNIVVQLYYGFNSRTPCGVRLMESYIVYAR